VIRVERGWDPAEGPIELKSHAGRRRVPTAAVLRAANDPRFRVTEWARAGSEGGPLSVELAKQVFE
jgi:hypothetical protein